MRIKVFLFKLQEGSFERFAPWTKGFEPFANTIHLSEGQRLDDRAAAPFMVVCDLVWAARAWNQTAMFGGDDHRAVRIHGCDQAKGSQRFVETEWTQD